MTKCDSLPAPDKPGASEGEREKICSHLTYEGKLGSLCEDLTKLIASKRHLSEWIQIHVKPASTSFDSANRGYLKAFRRLVRICPHAVFCVLHEPRIAALDLVIALSCDGVDLRCPSLEVHGEGEDLEMARRHVQVFSGSHAPMLSGTEWPTDGFGLCQGFFGPWVEAFPSMLPYIWMGIRHAGMAMLTRPDGDDSKPTCEQQRAMEDCYASCKSSALFASFDAVSKRSSVVASVDDAVVDAAMAQSITVERSGPDFATVILTSDFIFLAVPQIQQKFASILGDKDVTRVHVRLTDGEVGSSRSIFPRGAAKHGDIFKWHRKWEQIMATLSNRELVCTVEGIDLCPPQMELFFAAKVRQWKAPVKKVCWGQAPFWYSPGPEAMKGSLCRLPVATLRQLLLVGVPLKELQSWGVLEDHSDAFSSGSDSALSAEEGSSAAAAGASSSSAPLAPAPAVPAALTAAALAKFAPPERSMGRRSTRRGIDGLRRHDSILSEHLDDFNPCALRTASMNNLQELVSRTQSLPRLDLALASAQCGWEYGGGLLDLPEQEHRPQADRGSCSLVGYGLSTPGEEHKWTQAKVAEMLKIPEDHPHRSLFKASHIKTRYLADLERDLKDPSTVTLTRLREKHLHWAQVMLSEAIGKACVDANIDPKQLRHISVCSTSGYLLPGLTAYVAKDPKLGISPDIARQDIIGMGCHAGLNSFKSAAAWATANPGKYAIACGVEVMSAQYVWGDVSRTQLNNVICNSLFGDGCFAAVLYSKPEDQQEPPKAYLDAPAAWWTQYVDTGAIDDMIYHVEESENKYRFDLSELAPYHVAQGLNAMMRSALYENIPVHMIDHVVIHTGGRTVLNCSMAGLGLEGDPAKKVAHTVESLRDFGNQSSSSFMFAFDKLVRTRTVRAGDNGLFVTMGPGAGLEMAMWTAGERFEEAARAARAAA